MKNLKNIRWDYLSNETTGYVDKKKRFVISSNNSRYLLKDLWYTDYEKYFDSPVEAQMEASNILHDKPKRKRTWI